MFKDIKYFFNNREPVMMVFCILFLILPGVATLFIYNYDLFLSLDWIKLILLSCCFTTPFILINTLAILEFEDIKTSDAQGLAYAFSLATIISGLMESVALIISHFLWHSFDMHLILIALGEIMTVIIIRFGSIENKK